MMPKPLNLIATTLLLALALPAYAEKADKFVHQVGALSIWSYDRNDGTPYQECDEPADGFVDSHTCLMGLIEQARVLQEAE